MMDCSTDAATKCTTIIIIIMIIIIITMEKHKQAKLMQSFHDMHRHIKQGLFCGFVLGVLLFIIFCIFLVNLWQVQAGTR